MNDALEQTTGTQSRLAALAALAALAHVTAADHHSHDYMDLWVTPWGRWSRRLAYRTAPLGNLVFSSPMRNREAS